MRILTDIRDQISEVADEALRDTTFDDFNALKQEVSLLNANQVEAIVQEKINTLKQSNQLREYLTTFTVIFIGGWSFFLGCLVWSVGNGKLFLSDTVLVTLLTTTTANYVGILVIITQYLFPRPSKSN